MSALNTFFAILLSSLFVALTAYGWASLFSIFTTQKKGLHLPQKTSFSEFIFLGFIFIWLVFGILHFAFALNPYFSFIIILTGTLCGLLFNKQQSAIHKTDVLFLLFSFLLSSAIVSLGTTNFDTERYYILFIEILSERPLFRGINFIHNHLGFNSAWHYVSAAYKNPFVGWHFSFAINSTLLGAFIHYLLKQLKHLYFESHHLSAELIFPSLLLWSLCSGAFYLTYGLTRSPSPDLAAMLYCLMGTFIYLNTEKHGNANKVLAICLFAFALVIKISSFSSLFLILLCLYSLRNTPYLRGTLVFVFCVFFLQILSGYIMTGCLMYPEPLTCTPVSWRISINEIGDLKQSIVWWARRPNMHFSEAKILGPWITEWWHHTRSSRFIELHLRILKLTLPLISFSCLGLLLKTKSPKALLYNSSDRQLIILISVFACSVLLWVMSAPDIRFALASISAFTMLLLTLLLKLLIDHYIPINRTGIKTFVLIVAIFSLRELWLQRFDIWDPQRNEAWPHIKKSSG